MSPILILFYTFLAIFALTAIITLLGVTQKVCIEKKYLNALFLSLLLELVGAVIGVYKAGASVILPPPPVVETIPTVQTLPGMRWTMNDGLFHMIVFLQDGKFIDFQNLNIPAEQNHWSISASNIVLKGNNGFAIYTGILRDLDSIDGTATNIMGKHGTWTATRLR